MALSPREKSLVLVLPAVGVIAVYGLFYFRDQLSRTNRLRDEVAAARTSAPSPAAEQMQNARLEAVRQEIEQEAKDMVVIEKRWRAASGKGDAIPNRPERIRQFNGLLAKSGLRVIEARDTEGRNDNRMYPALDTIARELAELSENQQPKRRLVRCYGSYSSIFATLNDMAAGKVMAVPLGLSMKRGDVDSPWREWTLVIWL